MHIPSVEDNPQALQEVLNEAKIYLSGFTIEEFEQNGKPSLLAYIGNKRPEKFKLLLNAHLDVVPGKPEQFQPKEQKGKLYGRGAYDMKAAAAVMIVLFAELAKKVSYPLGLQLVTDEELGGQDGTKYQLQEGVLADFVIAGENTNLAVKDKAKGIIWVTLTAHGKTAHGAKPWLGENAIIKLMHVVEGLFETYPIPEKEAWQTTINLERLDTNNHAFNKIPDTATAYLDIRYVPSDKNAILQQLKTLESEHITVHIVLEEPAMETDIHTLYFQRLLNSIESITGKKAEILQGHGASDIRFYTSTGTPATEFGPIGEGDHQDNEWVNIQSLETYYEILKKFMLDVQ